MSMVQPVLTPANGVGDISVCAAAQAPDEFLVFWGLALIERIDRKSDPLSAKLLAARLYNLGFKVSALVSVFGHAGTTLRRWGQALKSGDPDRLRDALSGQGPPRKVTPQIERYVRREYRRLYGNCRDYRIRIRQYVAEIFQVCLSGERLRWIFNEERQRIAAEGVGDDDVAGAGDAANSLGDAADGGDTSSGPSADGTEANICVSGDRSASNFGTSGNYSLWRNEEAGGDEALPCHQPYFCHQAGLTLLLPAVQQLLSNCSCPRHRAVLRQFCAQILCGAVNHEQSKLMCSKSLQLLLGAVLRDTDYQRQVSDQLATPETIAALMGANMRFVGAQGQQVFYYDPHTKEYTGLLKILKGWCGGVHAVRRVMNMDFIHTLGGAPCFVRHFDNFQDMRERFFICREKFAALRGGNDSITWVADRGLFGLKTLQKIVALDDHFVTWEKGYKGDGWDPDAPMHTFRQMRCRNCSTDLRTYEFSFQEQCWEKDQSVRRLIVRAQGPSKGKKPIQVSILSSDPAAEASAVIWWMFNRWLQENDFGYLIRHFGISELTSRAYDSYLDLSEELADIDRQVESRDHRQLRRQQKAVGGKLGTALVRRERSGRISTTRKKLAEEKAALKAQRQVLHEAIGQLDSIEPDAAEQLSLLAKAMRKLTAGVQGYEHRHERFQQRSQLEKQIKELKGQLADIDQRLTQIPVTESRLQALEEDGYVRLNTARKALMDTVRICCRNVFYQAIEPFRQLYDNYRDDHVRFRAVTRAPGIITRTDDDRLEISLLPNMDMPPAVRKVIEEHLAAHSHIVSESLRESGSPATVCFRLPPPGADTSAPLKLPP